MLQCPTPDPRILQFVKLIQKSISEMLMSLARVLAMWHNAYFVSVLCEHGGCSYNEVGVLLQCIHDMKTNQEDDSMQ